MIKNNDYHLIDFDKIMQRLLAGKNSPMFVRLKSRNEFTDGFMISNCDGIDIKDLKSLFLQNNINVNLVIHA